MIIGTGFCVVRHMMHDAVRVEARTNSPIATAAAAISWMCSPKLVVRVDVWISFGNAGLTSATPGRSV